MVTLIGFAISISFIRLQRNSKRKWFLIISHCSDHIFGFFRPTLRRVNIKCLSVNVVIRLLFTSFKRIRHTGILYRPTLFLPGFS